MCGLSRSSCQKCPYEPRSFLVGRQQYGLSTLVFLQFPAIGARPSLRPSHRRGKLARRLLREGRVPHVREFERASQPSHTPASDDVRASSRTACAVPLCAKTSSGAVPLVAAPSPQQKRCGSIPLPLCPKQAQPAPRSSRRSAVSLRDPASQTVHPVG
jgi:hypothetical protein